MTTSLLTKSYFNTLFSTNFSSINKSIKMQTSITMFFKSKPPAETPPQSQRSSEEEMKQDKLETPEKTLQTQQDVKDKDTDRKEKPEANNESKTPKRKIDPDNGDEENRGGESVANKRQAMASPLCKPLKLETTASPLIDVKAAIRRKISNGAHALHENMGASWFRALMSEFEKPYFKKLSAFIKQERLDNTVFPPEDQVFTWTHFFDIKETRVLILGQDPYFHPRQAHGLSFSVQAGVKVPPSLVNIYKELEADIPGFRPPMNGTYMCGDLTGWAKQGVLMLNTCLSVRQGQAFSHQNKGWETFTDAVIKWISKNINHKMVFLLWGKPAQKKANLIDPKHKVLTAAHPSPLSAHNGFFGCGHFSKTNAFLKDQALSEIDWKAL